MRMRKPSRVTTLRLALLSGTRSVRCRASMPRARSRRQTGTTRRLTAVGPAPAAMQPCATARCYRPSCSLSPGPCPSTRDHLGPGATRTADNP